MAAHFNDSDLSLALVLRRTAANLDGEAITLRQLLELVGEQGLLLFCCLLTMPFLFPVSIPGVSTAFGIVIILIGIGVTLNRVPWLPQKLMDRTVAREHLVVVLEKGAKTFDRLEHWVKPRFNVLTTGSMVNQVNGVALTTSGILLLFPLSFIPFSNTLPALTILFFAFGTLQRDGYLILLGYVSLSITLLYFAGLALLLMLGGQSLL